MAYFDMPLLRKEYAIEKDCLEFQYLCNDTI